MLFSAADLIAGRGTPVTARPTEPLAVALERMAEHDYSQLPVVDEHDPPRALGIVTADSSIRAIRAFGAAIADLRVDEALIKAPQFRLDEDLLDRLDDLRDAYAALIVDVDDALRGIVTNFDLVEYFRRRTEDLMYVEDIETRVRGLIQISLPDDTAVAAAIESIRQSNKQLKGRFRQAVGYYISDASALKGIDATRLDEAFDRHLLEKPQLDGFDSLNLSEYIQLLLAPERWDTYKVAFGIERSTLRNLLEGVRITRNILAHFKADRLAARTATSVQRLAGSPPADSRVWISDTHSNGR